MLDRKRFCELMRHMNAQKHYIEHYINMQQLSFFALAFLTQTDFFFFYQNVINLTEEKSYKPLWFFKSLVPPSG